MKEKFNMRVVYCLPSLYISGGMERVLTIKANYFAEMLGYDIYIVLTDGKKEKPFYNLSPKIHLIHLDLNFNELWNKPLYKKILIYFQKQKRYKSRLKHMLYQIQPDITISMLRREINFLCSIHDGSLKIGELHVNKANYRDLSEERGISFINKLLAQLWLCQLNHKLKQLSKFVLLTQEDRANWSHLKNIEIIPNPLPFYPIKTSSCENKQVIAVGRYTYQKGFDQLLAAWKIVSEKHPDWVLRIYGDGMRK